MNHFRELLWHVEVSDYIIAQTLTKVVARNNTSNVEDSCVVANACCVLNKSHSRHAAVPRLCFSA